MNEADPERLILSGELPQLQRDLAALGGLPPADYDVGAGLARFAATRVPNAAPTSGSPAASGSAAGGWLKLLVVVALATGVVLAVSARDDDAPAAAIAAADASPTEAAPAPVERPNIEPTVAPQPAVTPPPEAEPALEGDAQTVAPRKAKPRRSAPAPEAAPATVDPPAASGKDDIDAREIAATGEMKRLARTDPARCLELAAQAQREFGDGNLGLERSAYEIIALFGVGRTETARTRARAYLQAHPNGPQVDRIRALAEQ